MTAIFDLLDGHVTAAAALDPLAATMGGVVGYDDEVTDLSPEGAEARADLDRRTLGALRAAAVEDERDRVARDFAVERLEADLAFHESQDHLRPLRILRSPVQLVRMVFDVMVTETDDDWDVVAARMAKVPDALAGLTVSLREGMGRGLLAPRRQALACADQASTWGGQSGTGSAGSRPFFVTLAEGHPGLAAPAEAATRAYAELATFLRDEYAPAAPEADAVGREAYRLWSRLANGAELDLDEAYGWGWDELARIEADMEATAERIAPGQGLAAAVERLETDDDLAIEGPENLRAWLQDLMDRTIDELDGVHFTIPQRVKRVEAMIAPPGGAAAMYYTGPSEDFRRPGRTWYPTLGRTRFPTWGEVSIAYHEGVPGHHLQIAQVRHLAGPGGLSRYQQSTFVSGHGEGWALYAERLMDELGYLTDPGHRLGYLRAQAFRAARVVVDIGLHLGLAAPDTGERWTPESAERFMLAHSRMPAPFVASEIVRYLGWPAQATSYKLGERVWLEARAEVQRRAGAGFDARAYHARALDLGPMGLDQLRRELVAPKTTIGENDQGGS